MVAGTQWAAWEEDTVRQHYAVGGTAACRALLPHRSAPALRSVARRLGVGYVGEHIGPSQRPDFKGTPTHDYTAPDYAMRAWRYPVESAQLRAIA